jgi:hypothetical protein
MKVRGIAETKRAKANRDSERTSFGYDLVLWHQNCPGLKNNDLPSPRFVATARRVHGVTTECRKPSYNREEGTVSLFCERCPAWITVGIREVRPRPHGGGLR